MADAEVLSQESESVGAAEKLLAVTSGVLEFTGEQAHAGFRHTFRVLASAKVGETIVVATSDSYLYFFQEQGENITLVNTLHLDRDWEWLHPLSRVILCSSEIPKKRNFLAYLLESDATTLVGAFSLHNGNPCPLTKSKNGALVGENGQGYFHPYTSYNPIQGLQWRDHGEYQPPSLLVTEKGGKVHRFTRVDPPPRRWWQGEQEPRWYAVEI